MNAIDKLLSISGPSLYGRRPGNCTSLLANSPARGRELRDILTRRNGFFAFEQALHVFPSAPAAFAGGLEWWNSHDLWRNGYQDLAEGYVFFAEDIFGEQFALKDELIYRFQPETGAVKLMGSSLNEWAECILSRYKVETGWPLAHDWQVKHGSLKPGQRLIPKQPFVLEGSYSIENLYVAECVQAMQFRAFMAIQMRNMPDGARVRFVFKEQE